MSSRDLGDAFVFRSITPAVTFVVLLAGSPTLAQQPIGDLDRSGTVELFDWSRQFGNFTSALRPGEGTSTPEQGDLDGDMDIDTLDMLVMDRQIQLPEGDPLVRNCEPPVHIARAELIYDPATGSVLIDTFQSDCPVVGFTLVSAGEAFLPHQFRFPFAEAGGQGMDRTPFQLGHVDPLFRGIAINTMVDLGEILPPGLNEDVFLSSIDRAEFAYLANAQFHSGEEIPKDFTLVRLGLPQVGDTDRDSDIDTADLNQVIVHWTGADPDPPIEGLRFIDGDFDFDGDVDTADLNGAIANWMGAAAARVNVIPEPSGAILALLAGILGMSVRRAA